MIEKIHALHQTRLRLLESEARLRRVGPGSVEQNAQALLCLQAQIDIELALQQVGLTLQQAGTLLPYELDDIIAQHMESRSGADGDPEKLRAYREALVTELYLPMIEHHVQRSGESLAVISMDELIASLRQLQTAAVDAAALASKEDEVHPGFLTLASQLVHDIACGTCGILQFSFEPSLKELLDSDDPAGELEPCLEAAAARGVGDSDRDPRTVEQALMVFARELCTAACTTVTRASATRSH